MDPPDTRRTGGPRDTPGSRLAAEEMRALAAAEASGWMGAVIELRILRSLALVRQGEPHAAQADLERALALAEPEGYVRIFLDEGLPMMQLLRELQDSLLDPALKDYVDRLLFAFALSA